MDIDYCIYSLLLVITGTALSAFLCYNEPTDTGTETMVYMMVKMGVGMLLVLNSFLFMGMTSNIDTDIISHSIVIMYLVCMCCGALGGHYITKFLNIK